MSSWKKRFCGNALSFPCVLALAIWGVLFFVFYFVQDYEIDKYISIEPKRLSILLTANIILFAVVELSMLIFFIVYFITEKDFWKSEISKKQNIILLISYCFLVILISFGCTCTTLEKVSPRYVDHKDGCYNAVLKNITSEINLIKKIKYDVDNNCVCTIECSDAYVKDEYEYVNSSDKMNYFLYLYCGEQRFIVGDDDYNELTTEYNFEKRSTYNNMRFAKYVPAGRDEYLSITYYENSKVIISIDIREGKQ